MTDEEKAREIASKYERWNQEDDESYGAYNGAIEMAKWKEQQMIDKACEWLIENYPTNDGGELYVFIKDFKKAMEEQQ